MAFLTENRSARLEFGARGTPRVSYFSPIEKGKPGTGHSRNLHRIALFHPINRVNLRESGEKKFDYPIIKVKSAILISIFISTSDIPLYPEFIVAVSPRILAETLFD